MDRPYQTAYLTASSCALNISYAVPPGKQRALISSEKVALLNDLILSEPRQLMLHS